MLRAGREEWRRCTWPGAPGSRAYSFSAAPQPDGQTLLTTFIRRVPGGAFTERLFTEDLSHQQFEITAPHGSFWLRDGDGPYADFEPRRDVGMPGEPPFTRGIHPTGYRSRPWTMRMFAGFGSGIKTLRAYSEVLPAGVVVVDSEEQDRVKVAAVAMTIVAAARTSIPMNPINASSYFSPRPLPRSISIVPATRSGSVAIVALPAPHHLKKTWQQACLP